MRIVFMGTPDFAATCLRALIDSGFNTVGVFSQPDRPSGRGYKLVAPAVKNLAVEEKIPVYQPSTLRGGEALQILSSLKPDLIAVAAYGKILPGEILSLPKLGCINVHASLLPKYRGAAPIQWSIINGETETGVTTMLMDKGLDTGDILMQASVPAYPDETALQLTERLAQKGAGLLIETIKKIQLNDIVPLAQDSSRATYAPMLKKSDGALDFSRPAFELANLVRGVSVWPVAYAYLGNRFIKVHKATARADLSGEPGTILPGKALIVACGSGALELSEVQPEGGKKMKGEDFLRGLQNLPLKKFTVYPKD